MSLEGSDDADSTPIRVLLVDDHPVVRSGLTALLASIPGFLVVAQAGNGEQAVREAAITSPDVVVMDLRMPGMGGVAATQAILRNRPTIAVLVLTMYDEDERIEDALRVGARGYLLKGAEQEEIERAIRTVAAGDMVLGKKVADAVRRLATTRHTQTVPLPTLTPRERDVLDRMAAGASNATIAAQLSMAPKTVGNHISAIFLKLGVASRAEAIVQGREAGLGRIRHLPGSAE